MIDQATFIKLAREAGFVHSNAHSAVIVRHSNGAWVSIEERLHQFAALVAAAEREACYQIALTIGDDDAGCRHTDEVARRIRARSNT